VRNDSDRERMLDMDRRLAPPRRHAFAVLGLALLLSGPWIGWWPVLPLVACGLLFALANRYASRLGHPEVLFFAVWALSEFVVAACVLFTGGPDSPALAWLAVPVVTLCARFSSRGIVLGVVIALAMLAGVTYGVDTAVVVDDPSPVLAVAALIVATALLSTALMQSDIEHREEAVLDPLTQLLNRKALEQRAKELTQQSMLRSDPIGVVIGDLDHFKRINDTLGHATGDAVLRDVAYLIRKQLRAFDLVYRMGGEEFLLLLPGSDADSSSDIAERLRTVIAAEPLGGQAVTMSFGVAATEPGETFDLADVAAAADRALYTAKADGRDRVRTEDPRLAPGIAPAAPNHGVESLLRG
jgi:diguanylate cyclase (GGDEF)-like protein